MRANDCVFCKIIAGQIPCNKVYEDDGVLAFLDIQPVSDGHTLVIPKAHFETLHECPPDILAGASSCLGIIANAVVAATGAQAYNVLCNNGRAAGQLVKHVHFHVIPRISGDGVFGRWPAGEYAQGRAESIAASIRENI